MSESPDPKFASGGIFDPKTWTIGGPEKARIMNLTVPNYAPPVARYKVCRPGAVPPRQARPGDAGYDLTICENARVWDDQDAQIHTGLKLQLPAGYYARITGRSSSTRKGLYVLEGIIDNGYRGEMIVFARYAPPRDRKRFMDLTAGMRVAQLLLHRIEEVTWTEGELDESERGEGGFGSTGV